MTIVKNEIKNEVKIGDTIVIIDDIGYHIVNGEKRKTVHFLSHVPYEFRKEIKKIV